MSERFYSNRDLGDETDFDAGDVYRQGVMAFLMEDPTFREQLAISSRVVAEGTLPAGLIEQHQAVLSYWGHLLTGKRYPLQREMDLSA